MTTQEILLKLIESYLGKPYKWGGDDPLAGFDCSGAILELLHSVGLPPEGDSTAQGIFNYYKMLSVLKPRFGSLAFYGKDTTKITHVTFCLNDRLMFEFGGGDSRVRTPEEAIDRNAYGRIRPIRRRKELVALVNPPYP